MQSLKPHDRAVKLDEMHSILCVKEHYDIICVSETWLDDTINDDDVELPGYQVFRKDQSRYGGGVTIYVHDSVPVKYLNAFNIAGTELVCIEIKHKSKSFLVSCWYRPPGSNCC